VKELSPFTRLAIVVASAIAGVGVLFAFGLVVRTYRNTTASMEPALPQGTHMIVVRALTAKRGEMVVFRYPRDPRTTSVKRIVATSGDIVEIRAKQLFVNGQLAVEPYASFLDPTIYPSGPFMPEPYRSRDHFGPYRVPQDSFFMLGDNRDRSSDSRYWGAVPREHVIGRPIVLFSWKHGFRKL
jgi:signal peptidase I